MIAAGRRKVEGGSSQITLGQAPRNLATQEGRERRTVLAGDRLAGGLVGHEPLDTAANCRPRYSCSAITSALRADLLLLVTVVVDCRCRPLPILMLRQRVGELVHGGCAGEALRRSIQAAAQADRLVRFGEWVETVDKDGR